MPGTGMQIAWLLSLAGAAALNVTITNTLVGTTTVRVNGAGRDGR